MKLTAEKLKTEFIRTADSLKDGLAFLDIALQQVRRLYPDGHEYRQTVERIHGDTAGL